MLRQTIVFYGPTGGKGNRHLGGGESGNRRTIALLQQLGFNVIVQEKPILTRRTLLGFIVYFTVLMYTAILTAIRARFLQPKALGIHVSGFYQEMIYPELMIIFLAKVLRVPCIYEIRAGGAIDSYNQNSRLYRFAFRLALKLSSHILAQGECYLQFFQDMTGTKMTHYPNFVYTSQIPQFSEIVKSSDSLELVYFGRISPTKSIEEIITAVKILKELNFPVHCTIIGNGHADYLESLREKTSEYGIQECLIFTPALDHNALYQELPKAHFFVFPSKEPREGHSNSLTEAMAFGVVPIASDHGFNASVIGNNNLILTVASGDFIAKKIAQILASGSYEILSKQVYDRVRNTFTDHHALSSLRTIYIEQFQALARAGKND